MTALGRDIKDTLRRLIGVPVCVGIAETRTLAKLANRSAKKPPGQAARHRPWGGSPELCAGNRGGGAGNRGGGAWDGPGRGGEGGGGCEGREGPGEGVG